MANSLSKGQSKISNDLPFSPDRIKIEKVEKLAANLHNKKEYVIHIGNLKQASNHGLELKKVQNFIKFNQRAWRKSYIDMNTELSENAKDDFEKGFFKLMNTAVFGKTMENVRKQRDIKLETTKSVRNYLGSETNYHTTNFFSENLSATEMRKNADTHKIASLLWYINIRIK